MPEVKKIATRDSYGNALAELGAEHEEIVVLDSDLAAATKTAIFKEADLQQQVKFRLQVPLQCLQQDEHMNR